MADVRANIKHEEPPAAATAAADHHHHHRSDEHMANVDPDNNPGQDYYGEGYDEQYEATGERGDVTMYDEQGGTGDRELDPNDAYAAMGAAEVVSAVVASVAGDEADPEGNADIEGQNYEYQQESPQEYTSGQPDAHREYNQEEYHDEDAEVDYEGHEMDAVHENGGDGQTLASHPVISNEMDTSGAMVVDESEHNPNVISEVSEAMDRYDYHQDPDPLQTLAATSSAVTPHGGMDTPSKSNAHRRQHHSALSSPTQMYANQKPMMPKFNRARNWTAEETRILLDELERIVSNNPDERRENLLRSHATFEEIAEVLRSKDYTNRDGQGCMIRWRNLLRVYKQVRAALADGNPPPTPQNLQYASAIESIYRFPPDGMQYQMHNEDSPGMEPSPMTGSRTWSQANGSSYETPARKRARELSMISDHIEQMDQKLEQTLEYMSQQNELLRSLEERLSRTEDALKQSEATVAELNTTIGEKDARREELQNQLMVTVQALSQVIATKKEEQQQQAVAEPTQAE
ncbi:hypothetical protein H4R20_002533 [Coemansia guatemalensis]|uniref:Myb-like domain-containing protein n=1 Tax=Coemansia guatemalensis TaxID=2761395 RepID=A0A9W8HVB2_9FUNG|nr:hypothetical protein H4R20_002533 [Coemansia guatemalensis]